MTVLQDTKVLHDKMVFQDAMMLPYEATLLDATVLWITAIEYYVMETLVLMKVQNQEILFQEEIIHQVSMSLDVEILQVQVHYQEEMHLDVLTDS